MVGGPFDPGSTRPLSVNTKFFDRRCPNPTKFRSDEVNALLDTKTQQAEAMEMWVEKLTNMEDKCIEIDAWSGQVFDFE